LLQEYAIALAENAVDNGIELRIRREVQEITYGQNLEGIFTNGDDGKIFTVQIRHWEPADFVDSVSKSKTEWLLIGAVAMVGILLLVWVTLVSNHEPGSQTALLAAGVSALCGIFAAVASYQLTKTNGSGSSLVGKSIVQLVDEAGPPIGSGDDGKVEVPDMLVGGSGSSRIQQGVTVETETVRARYIVNCAGGASDQIANMIGDNSFKIKPRLGDYLLLHRNQVSSCMQRLAWDDSIAHR
jgi:hypothetical protein